MKYLPSFSRFLSIRASRSVSEPARSVDSKKKNQHQNKYLFTKKPKTPFIVRKKYALAASNRERHFRNFFWLHPRTTFTIFKNGKSCHRLVRIDLDVGPAGLRSVKRNEVFDGTKYTADPTSRSECTCVKIYEYRGIDVNIDLSRE